MPHHDNDTQAPVFWAPKVPEGWVVGVRRHPDHEAPIWEINSTTDLYAGGWIVPYDGGPLETHKVAYRCSEYDYLSDSCMPDWYLNFEQVLEGVAPGSYQFHTGGDVQTCARKLTGP